MTTFGVFDSSIMMVEGASALIAKMPDCTVSHRGSNAADILALSNQPCPDVALVDLFLPGDVLSAIRFLTCCPIATRVIVVADTQSTAEAVAALNAGASALVTRSCSAHDMLDVAQRVLNGEIYVSPLISARIIAFLQNQSATERQRIVQRLTVREEQIARMLLTGKKNRDIARALDLSEKTVKSYMTGLLQKFNARSRLEIVVKLQEDGDRVMPQGRREVRSPSMVN